MVLLTGNVPPVKLAQRAWYHKRYRDNWPMLLQARMRVGAPRWWPWVGLAPTSSGPRRATPLAAPRTPRLERPTPLAILDLEESDETAVGAPAGGPVATTFGRLTLATAPALPRGAATPPEEEGEDTDVPPPGRGSVPPPRPRSGVMPVPGRPRTDNPWDNADGAVL